MLKLLAIFFSIYINANATCYKIGSKISISDKEIEKLYNATKAWEQNMSLKEFKDRVIYVRSFVLSLKLARQIPENYKNANIFGYEADEMIFAQYLNKLKEAMMPSAEQIKEQRALYDQMGNRKLYLLREIEADSGILAMCKKSLDASSDKANVRNGNVGNGNFRKENSIKQVSTKENSGKENFSKEAGKEPYYSEKLNLFIDFVKKYSNAKSVNNKGTIGLYNPDYDIETASMFNNAKENDSIIIDNKLYFVEKIIDFNISNEQLAQEVVREKVSAYVNNLMLYYPIEVVEIN